MGSSRGQDQSLGSGLSLPQWMKGRGEARYDFDENSFSPPSHDDSFLAIRYSSKSSHDKKRVNQENNHAQEGYRSINQVLSENTITSSGSNNDASSSSGTSNTTIIKDIKSIDFSKHPLPCQPFVPAAGGKETTISSSIGSTSKYKFGKSQGTDDGFHSEPALCGKSIVRVANRMMSRKLSKIDSAIEATEDYGNSTTLENQQHEKFTRRGSKSLPVTPIASPSTTPDTSPKSRRRANANRYFTGPFVLDRDKYQTGWLLSSILGHSRDAALATSGKIPELDEDEQSTSLDVLPSRFLNRKKSISSQNLSYVGVNEESQQQNKQNDDEKKETIVYTNVFRAKPSELREMNFWSPTSM